MGEVDIDFHTPTFTLRPRPRLHGLTERAPARGYVSYDTVAGACLPKNAPLIDAFFFGGAAGAAFFPFKPCGRYIEYT